MNMKPLILIITAASLIGGAFPGYAGSRHQHDRSYHESDHHGNQRVTFERRSDRKFQHYLDKRQRRQAQRIERGLDSGELTHKESKRLARKQRKIARLERKFSADGRYTKRERQLLRERLDSTSDLIYRKKHNDFTRPQRYTVEDWAPQRSFSWDYGRHNRMGSVWEDGHSRWFRE